MRAIYGDEAEVSLWYDGQYYPIFCASDFSFNYRQDVLLGTSRTTGIARVKRLRGLYEFSVSLNGLTKIDNTDGQISFFWLLQQATGEQQIKIAFEDEDGNTKNITCDVIIPEMSIGGNVTSFLSASVVFEGSGTYTIDDTDPPTAGDEFPLWLPTVAGETSVTHADLGGATILLVGRETMGYTKTTGTPSGRQFKYTDNTTSGTIEFDPNVPFESGEVVYVLYRG